tara:strand:- start:1008 stop:1664 length:657 start_codon:yes stop_codon:yes gene_type:complete
MVITIDGAAGVGKTSTAKEVAKKLGFQYFDTGSMYRAVTLYFLEKNVDISSMSEVDKALNIMKLKIDFSEKNDMKLLLDGNDISLKIRNQNVTKNVSAVSAIKSVRTLMVGIQRSVTQNGNFVVEGRDIGTVVFPDAKHKFFLEADYDARAKRRMADFMKINEVININEIKEDLIERDKYDSGRKLSPLKKPMNAVIINTSNCSFEEQVDQILKNIES